jgi:hypothetical protein
VFLVVILVPALGKAQRVEDTGNSTLGLPITVAPRPGGESPALQEISDAVVDKAGNIYIVDAKRKLLAVFSRSGAAITTLHGRNPHADADDFPGIALAIDASDVVYTLERWGRKIRKYRLQRSALQLVDSFDTNTPMGSFCISGTDLYLLGFQDGAIVHRYDLTGHHVASFGLPYSRNLGISETSTRLSGRMACLPEAKIVAVGTAMFDSVRAYSNAGSLLWVFSPPGFRAIQVKDLPDAAYEIRLGNRPTDAIAGLLRGPGGRTVGIRVEQINGAQHIPDATKTYFVDATSGRLVESNDSLPQILRTVRELAIVVHNEKQPVVSIREWQHRARRF